MRKLIANNYFLVIIASAMYAVSDVILKSVKIGDILESNSIYDFGITVFIFGISLLIALLSKLIMGKIVSEWDLGKTQSIFIALTIIMTFILGVIIFKEPITTKKTIGIILLLIGSYLLISKNNDSEQII